MTIQTAATSIALLALSGAAGAQTVEFRVVQEALTGNASTVTTVPPTYATPLTPANPFGNYAVQARVTGGQPGAALAGFNFDIVLPLENDTYGTLTKMRISSADGTYFTGSPISNSSVGAGGLARQYTYLAGISPTFNGVVNTSTGTFTNNPNQQEIGLITAASVGTALLSTPGLDPNGEGNPVTWSGYGQMPPAVPNSGEVASLPAGLGPTYFAQGQFVDIYRFRYTTTFFDGRTVIYTLQNVGASVFSQLIYGNGSWGAQATTVPTTNITVTPISLGFPAPSTCAPLAIAALMGIGRRRRKAGL